jgi:tetratricopeptide (TPR) repeat protein
VASIARADAIALVFVAFGALGVSRLQPQLASTVHEVKARQDDYALPPPRQLKMMTFGYHAAAVDMLWAKLLVEYGIHWSEHRDFLDLNNYLDSILEIEPDYAPLYKYVSTLLVYRPLQGYEKDARLARAILERGTRERPDDWQVWLDYGQFVAFLGPSWMPDEAERQRWRHDGALAIKRAVELGAASDRSIDVAAMLKKFGERDAAIRELERGYALTDDPQKQAQIAASLEKLEAAGQRDEIDRKRRLIENDWRASYPFASRGHYLMLGPIVDALKCAGPAEARGQSFADDNVCAHDWTSRLAPATR